MSISPAFSNERAKRLKGFLIFIPVGILLSCMDPYLAIVGIPLAIFYSVMGFFSLSWGLLTIVEILIDVPILVFIVKHILSELSFSPYTPALSWFFWLGMMVVFLISFFTHIYMLISYLSFKEQLPSSDEIGK
ncbi:MAG: hypothetical protein AAB660_01270 [Patescibacteria group bacterium]